MRKLVIRHAKTIRKKVYDYLREQILSGDIFPNERLIETKIAREIGSSRTPVREALHILESEGLLESIPRVGYRVKEIRGDEVEEICEIRKVNETLVAQWAMARITPKDFHSLEQNLFAAETEAKSGHPESFVDFDAEFHEILARISGSQRLLELCQTLRRHMLRYRIESLYLPDVALRAVAGHRRILECIKTKDDEGLRQAVHQHLDQSKRDILRYAFEEKPYRHKSGTDESSSLRHMS